MSNTTHTKKIARALTARTGMPYSRARRQVIAAMSVGLLPHPFTNDTIETLVDILCDDTTAAAQDAPVPTSPTVDEPSVDWSQVRRVKFPETGERWWTVRTLQGNFVVVTQQVPFEKKGILRYSVLDVARDIRGPVNLIGQGWSGVDTDRGCRTLARSMSLGVVAVSHRNNVPIRPTVIDWSTSR